MEVEKNVSVVVLAAGNSTRMTSPKPLLKWDKSLTFIEKNNRYLSFFWL